MAEKTDDLLARAVPKLAAQNGEKAQILRAKIGRFAARVWAKGGERLEAMGIDVPEKVRLAARSQALSLAEDGGGRFLVAAHEAFGDDEAFVVFAKSLVKAYARAIEQKKASASVPARTSRPRDEETSGEHPSIKVDEVEPDAPPPIVEKKEKDGKKAKDEKKENDGKRAKPEESSGEEQALEVPDEAPGSSSSPSPTPSPKKKEEPAALKKKERGAFDRIDLVEEQETMEEVARDATPVVEKPKPVDEKTLGLDAQASRAVDRYRKTGDPLELGNARKLYKQALESAKPAPAKAAAQAGIALVHLLNGQDEEAKKLAEKALQDDACCALAISVLARASHGEGGRERLKAGLARARLAMRDPAKAKKEAKLLAEAFPEEPAPILAALVAKVNAGEDYDEEVKAAWGKYPSPAFPDLPLGDGLDLPAAKAIVQWGASEVAQGGVEGLNQTQKDVESKTNFIAGAFQLALGLSRAALAARDVPRKEEQELRGVAAQALLGLQFYDAAAAAYEKAQSIERTGTLADELVKGAEHARELRRAFDKPGIKARMGSFEGVGAAALKKAALSRANRASTERQTETDAVAKSEMEAVVALAGSAPRRAGIEKRAKGGGKESPLEPLNAIESQLKELASAKEGLAKKEGEEKKGFFGRALDKVKDTAKGAELALRIKLLEGKRDDALRAVAKNLHDAPEGGWGDTVCDKLAVRGKALDAKLEQIDDDLAQARKITAKLAEL